MNKKEQTGEQEPVTGFELPDVAAGAGKMKTLREFWPVLVLELLFTGVMLAIYALCSRLNDRVLWGALIGTGLTVLNFVIMSVSLMNAEKAADPAKGALRIRVSSTGRTVALFVVLALLLKTGRFDPIATLLPLCFLRLALFASQIMFNFVQKKRGEN